MFLVVGAGFTGSVLARCLADRGNVVTVVDGRKHLAGNCHTERDPKTGVMEHLYGPHIFHTNNDAVWGFVNKFAEMVPYRHNVYSTINDEVFSMPINLHTINQFFRKTLNPSEAEQFIKSLSIAGSSDQSFEQAAFNSIGRELYEAFFKGYTQKQWGRNPKDLPASVFGRLPVRFSYDANYFSHRFQGIPRNGYTELVAGILDHPKIRVCLNENVNRSSSIRDYRHVFWTGALDQYYENCHGPLEYRTLRFDREIAVGDFQGCSVMNYPSSEVNYTRITEHKHFSPWESHEMTVVYREYSEECKPGDIPYYPVRLAKDKNTLARYVDVAKSDRRVSFLGRLGTYRYIDMDVAIGEALEVAERTLDLLDRQENLPVFFHSPV